MFKLTQEELMSDRLSHARLLALLNVKATNVHEVKVSTNNYGEWLFVTVSAKIPQTFFNEPATTKTRMVTFWGMGFHEDREAWLCESWSWFAGTVSVSARQTVGKDRAFAQIEARRTECLAATPANESVSARGQAFALFADLGDEDGAAAMLEDMEASGVDLEDLFDE